MCLLCATVCQSTEGIGDANDRLQGQNGLAHAGTPLVPATPLATGPIEARRGAAANLANRARAAVSGRGIEDGQLSNDRLPRQLARTAGDARGNAARCR